MRKTQGKPKKSALERRAEELFSFQQSGVPTPPVYVREYPGEPAFVQTYTTYSVGETPIPDPRNS